MIRLAYCNETKKFILKDEKDQVLHSSSNFFEIIEDPIFEKFNIIKNKKIDWSNFEDMIFNEEPIHGILRKDFVSFYLSKPLSSVLDNRIVMRFNEIWLMNKQIGKLKKISTYFNEKFMLLRKPEISFSYKENYDYDYKNYDSLDDYYKKEIKKVISKFYGKILKVEKINNNKYYIIVNNKIWNIKMIYCVRLKVIDNVYGCTINNEATGMLDMDCPKNILVLSENNLGEASLWREKQLKMLIK